MSKTQHARRNADISGAAGLAGFPLHGLMEWARQLRQHNLTIQAVDENSITIGRVGTNGQPGDARPRAIRPRKISEPQPKPETADLLTVKQAAKILKKRPSVVKRLAEGGKLPCVWAGKSLHILKEGVAGWLAEQAVTSPKEPASAAESETPEETPVGQCEQCHGPLPPRPQGQRGGASRRFCSAKCQSKAWRAAKKATPEAPQPVAAAAS